MSTEPIKIMTFEEFQQNVPSPVAYNFEKPLDLKCVFEAYHSLFHEEIDAAINGFVNIISRTNKWSENIERTFEHFEVAISVFWHLAKLHYPVIIYYDEEKDIYYVEVALIAFILKEYIGDNHLFTDNDFWVYFSATFTDDDRERAMMEIIGSNH